MPETLRQLINRGPVDPSTALNILGQLLKALELAHWRGVIYGDIAPENIVLTSTGQAPLARFGIDHAGDDSAPTQDDTAMGTPGYVAPEQINGDPADERTDIFALGVVAYEMLTGKHPFGASDGLSAGSVMDRILHETPLEIPEATLVGLPRHLPPALDVALGKRATDRFPDATRFLEALKGPPAVADVVVPDKPHLPRAGSPRVSRSRRKWLVASALGGLVVAALVVLWAVPLGGDSGPGSSATVTSGGTTSTGQPVPAIVPATTTTSVAPSTTTTTTTTTIAIVPPSRYEETESHLVYAGAWSTTADGSASGSSFLFANSSEASVSVTFEGTYLAWIAKKAPVYGKATVTLDGKNLGTIDLFSASIGWQQKVWGTGTLKSGLHTVTIAWTGTKNTAATDTNIGVDAFDVVGALRDPSF
ncbi:MAG: hypothetical protein A2133_12775 [Actinobacteria bacterium RBG_16_64_13]|nr:MAG: hypothetical protein A2133_12775 [Actinobacteria bacterium RBG_16_64_13]